MRKIKNKISKDVRAIPKQLHDLPIIHTDEKFLFSDKSLFLGDVVEFKDENGSFSLSKSRSKVALKIGLSILEAWKCTEKQKKQILDLDVEVIESEDVLLTFEHLVRISCLLNIHATLRSVFANKENVFGFMKLPNKNELFSGYTPLELIEGGDIEILRQIAEQLNLTLCSR